VKVLMAKGIPLWSFTRAGKWAFCVINRSPEKVPSVSPTVPGASPASHGQPV